MVLGSVLTQICNVSSDSYLYLFFLNIFFILAWISPKPDAVQLPVLVTNKFDFVLRIIKFFVH